MTKSTNRIMILAGALAMAAAPAFAHPGGGPPAGVGGGGGMGIGGGFSGSMGAMNGRGIGNASIHGGGGMNGGVSSGASTRVLSNTHVTTALTNSLSHSGVTLPSGGLSAACSGFSNLGGCVAALHVAQNLNLPGGFDALKALITGTNKMKLGAAITQLQPSANAKAAVHTANRQAETDLEATESD